MKAMRALVFGFTLLLPLRAAAPTAIEIAWSQLYSNVRQAQGTVETIARSAWVLWQEGHGEMLGEFIYWTGRADAYRDVGDQMQRMALPAPPQNPL